MADENGQRDFTEDFDEEEGEVQVAAPSNNGNGHHGLTPSQAQLLMAPVQRGGGMPPDPGTPLIETSTKPHEFLARTIVSEDEIGWFKRITLRNNIAQLGYVDESHLIWSFFAIRPSLDGKAREQYSEVQIGRQQQRLMDRASLMNRLTRSPEENNNGRTLQ